LAVAIICNAQIIQTIKAVFGWTSEFGGLLKRKRKHFKIFTSHKSQAVKNKQDGEFHRPFSPGGKKRPFVNQDEKAYRCR
jgi:hypothetical protein